MYEYAIISSETDVRRPTVDSHDLHILRGNLSYGWFFVENVPVLQDFSTLQLGKMLTFKLLIYESFGLGGNFDLQKLMRSLLVLKGGYTIHEEVTRSTSTHVGGQNLPYHARFFIRAACGLFRRHDGIGYREWVTEGLHILIINGPQISSQIVTSRKKCFK